MPGTLDGIVMFLAFAALGVFNLWIWQKSKALANLLMMCGAFGISLFGFAIMIESISFVKLGRWTMMFGSIALAYGFFLSAKPQIEAQLAKLKAKAQAATKADGEDPSAGDDKAES